MTMNETDSALRTVGSLCSGIGGLDLAIQGDLRFSAELDPAAASVLASEKPTIPNLGDITKVTWTETEHHVDLLTSGDPCQSMSSAGLQMASLDPRFLWPTVMEVIRKTRPREVFLENVQNLQSVPLLKGATDWRGERGSVLKLRLDDLQRAGYASKWMILGACAVGAPHHRHRWFLRATYVGQEAPTAERVLASCGAPRTGGRLVLPTPRARDWKGGSTLERPIDGGPDLPTAIAHLLPTVTASDGMGGPGKSTNGHDEYNLRTQVTLLDGTWGRFAPAIAKWEGIIGRPAPAPTVPGARGGKRLNPALAEWMMGYPEGYLTDRLPYKEALRTAGNGVVPIHAATAYGLLA
jgi:DNA (cytosine-5)-methyltransferase 1